MGTLEQPASPPAATEDNQARTKVCETLARSWKTGNQDSTGEFVLVCALSREGRILAVSMFF